MPLFIAAAYQRQPARPECTRLTAYKLTITAPGVLGNDSSGSWPGLYAANAGAPKHGTVTVNTNGSFAYTPDSGFTGMDCFTYDATDGTYPFGTAMVTIQVPQTGGLFNDDFARCDGRLSPWQVHAGNWTTGNGTMQASNPTTLNYANAFMVAAWSSNAVQARIQFPTNTFGGGLGCRLDPSSGSHYAAWIYPEGSGGGSSVLKIIRFTNWVNWVPLVVTNLPGVGTNWHTLKLSAQGSQLTAYYDTQQMATASDTNYTTGGVSFDMWVDAAPYMMSLSNYVVTPGP